MATFLCSFQVYIDNILIKKSIYVIDCNYNRTDFYYDDINRLIEKKLPADDLL